VDSLDESEKGNCLDLPSWQRTQTDVLFMESLTRREKLEMTRRVSREGWPTRKCQVEVRALMPTVIVRA
jgi:hypothetical protein